VVDSGQAALIEERWDMSKEAMEKRILTLRSKGWAC